MNTRPPTTKETQLKGKVLLISGTCLALLGAGLAYWYIRRKKAGSFKSIPILSGSTTTSLSSSGTPHSNRFRCTSSTYPLEYGTCHPDVKVLQQYLKKHFKESLGHTGPGKDGIDGMFGNLTRLAAKRSMGKTSFSISDIKRMKAT